MKIVFSPKCLEYEISGHPESPARVKNIFNVLKENDFKFISALEASKKDILLVHTQEHFERILNKNYFDLDTPVIEPTYPLLSVGIAIKAARERAFALVRPPGHHAGSNFLGGFCYFNNIAIAVRKEDKRTVILDLDTHHGQGIQDIFLGSAKVLYISIHQSPLYPGTGLHSEQNCINYPLPAGTNEKMYLKTLEKCLEQIERFKPELLAISIGFDTFKEDPLAGFLLEDQSYEKIGKLIADLNLPTFCVLEGGYSNKIGLLAYNFLKFLC